MQLCKTIHRFQAVIKIFSQNFYKSHGSFTGLSPFSVQSVLRMRETAQRARGKRGRWMFKKNTQTMTSLANIACEQHIYVSRITKLVPPEGKVLAHFIMP